MTEMRVVYSAVADRWEAYPVSADVVDVVEDEGVRLLIGDGGFVVGFAYDIDGDPRSRTEVLRRYLRVEPIADLLASRSDVDREMLVELESERSHVPATAVDTVRSISRFVEARSGVDRIAVHVRFAWWFALWGMWFSVARGDGLVLADRPVRRQNLPESLPNAFTVRPDDLRARLRRGPSTARRVALALCAALVMVLVAVVLAGGATGPATTAAAPVSTASVEPTPSPPASPAPTITLPVGRQPGTDYVSVDGSARLNVVPTSSDVSRGGILELELSFDKSAINPFGVVGADGNQSEAFRSCQANLDLYREVPMQPGASEQFRVYLIDASGGRSMLTDLFQQLQLVGAMVEGCPAPIVAGGGPYLILQRTFYAPLVLSMSVPDQLPAGEYEVHLEVGAQQWETATPLAVTID